MKELASCQSSSICPCKPVVSKIQIHSFSILHTHTHRQNASFMHLSLFYTAYFAFLGHRTASDFSTASTLSLISNHAWIIFGMRPITEVMNLTFCNHISSSLFPSDTLLLFCFVDICFFFFCFASIIYLFSSYFGMQVCVSVYVERQRWVPIMNNAWCGFLVSETWWGRWTPPRVLPPPTAHCS